MASADMQWLFYSGEQIMAQRPLVLRLSMYMYILHKNQQQQQQKTHLIGDVVWGVEKGEWDMISLKQK